VVARGVSQSGDVEQSSIAITQLGVPKTTEIPNGRRTEAVVRQYYDYRGNGNVAAGTAWNCNWQDGNFDGKFWICNHGGLVFNRSQVRLPVAHCWASTLMCDCLWASKPFRYCIWPVT